MVQGFKWGCDGPHCRDRTQALCGYSFVIFRKYCYVVSPTRPERTEEAAAQTCTGRLLVYLNPTLRSTTSKLKVHLTATTHLHTHAKP